MEHEAGIFVGLHEIERCAKRMAGDKPFRRLLQLDDREYPAARASCPRRVARPNQSPPRQSSTRRRASNRNRRAANQESSLAPVAPVVPSSVPLSRRVFRIAWEKFRNRNAARVASREEARVFRNHLRMGGTRLHFLEGRFDRGGGARRIGGEFRAAAGAVVVHRAVPVPQ